MRRSHRSLVEEYVLEIVARCRNVRVHCDNLRTLDFVSDSPEALAHALSRVCDYLEDVATTILGQIDWDEDESPEDDLQILRTLDDLLHEISARLRYVEGATTARLPWSVIAALERLVTSLLPNAQVLLRPQWHYNYGSHVADLRQALIQTLEAFTLTLERDVAGDVLKPIPRPFHILTFPALERKNILLHSLLGHEIGHLLVADRANETAKQRFLQSIRTEIHSHTRAQLVPTGRVVPNYLGPEQSFLNIRNFNEAGACWQRGITELLADVVGAALFGPAALFSALEMAMQEGLDIAPSEKTDHYPPWRMRLRLIWQTIQPERSAFFPVPANAFPGTDRRSRALMINARYRLIKDLISKDSDLDALNDTPIARIVYQRLPAIISKESARLLKGPIASHKISGPTLYGRVQALIDRLDNGIPPNVLAESSAKSEPAQLVDIINAAWLHKISWVHDDFMDKPSSTSTWLQKRNRLNNLTLKAIEFSDLALSFAERKPDALSKRNTE